MTAITLSILNISPKLNIQLHSWDYHEWNFPLLKIPIFDIIMPFKSLWPFLKGFAQNPKSNFIVQKRSFLSNLVLEIYVVNRICTGKIHRNRVETNYIKEKGILQAPIFLSILFMHIFVHTVRMKSLTIISGQLHLLHQFKSDFAHLLAFKNLFIELLNAKKWAKNNN